MLSSHGQNTKDQLRVCDSTVQEARIAKDSKPNVVLLAPAQVRKMRWGRGEYPRMGTEP